MVISRLLKKNDSGSKVFIILVLAATIILPMLNVFTSETNPLHVSSYTITILGKYCTYALLAIAVDLVWGYMGVLSLGHGAFFALGGYAMGMYLMRQIGDRGVYGNATLPDFMVFLDWKELPWFWTGSDSFFITLILIVLVPGLVAYIFGYLTFKSKISGVYLSIITQAFTYSLMLVFFRNEFGFGGNNGLTDFKDILGFSLQKNATKTALFIISGLSLLAGYLLILRITSSKLGRVIIAIRDSEDRVRFIGYKTEHFKVFVFTVSAAIAGIAGALYVPQVGIINPGEFSPLNSIEIIVWVAVGGRYTLYGAALGALFVNYAKTFFTSNIPELWLFALGAIFVIVTILLPKGIAGIFRKKS